MKKFKIVLWIIIIGLFVMMFFQNKAFFESKNSFTIDLFVVDAYTSPEIFNAVWVLVALVVGFLIAYFFSFLQKLKTNKLFKGMKSKIQEQEKIITRLRQEFGTHAGNFATEMMTAESDDAGSSAPEKDPTDV